MEHAGLRGKTLGPYEKPPIVALVYFKTFHEYRTRCRISSSPNWSLSTGSGTELVRPVRLTVILSCIIHFHYSTITNGAQCILNSTMPFFSQHFPSRPQALYSLFFLHFHALQGEGRRTRGKVTNRLTRRALTEYNPREAPDGCGRLYFS